jgi:hypothetical protein
LFVDGASDEISATRAVLKAKGSRKNGEEIQFLNAEDIFNRESVVICGQKFPTKLHLNFREPESERWGRWRKVK